MNDIGVSATRPGLVAANQVKLEPFGACGLYLARPDAPGGDQGDPLADLVRAAGADDLQGTLDMVATLAGCGVALLDPDRRLLAVCEPVGAADTGPGTAHARPPRRWITSFPRPDRELVIESGPRRLGSLIFRKSVLGSKLGPAVCRVVHDVLAMVLVARDATRRAAEAEQRVALLSCLSDIGDGPNDTAENATGGGLQSVRHRPVIVSPVAPVRAGAPAAPGEAGLVARVRAAIGRDALLADGQLAPLRERAVVLYAQRGDAPPREHAAAWQRVVADLAPLRCRVVVGLPSTPGQSIRAAYRTARWLADLQADEDLGLRLPDVALVDELGVLAGTLGPAWGDQLGHFIARVLGDVVDNDRFGGEMVDTLHAYLVCGGSSSEAGRLLHLSPSSIKYRMRIIRETLGDRLDDHDSVFEIELALRLLKSFEALHRIARGSGAAQDARGRPRGDRANRSPVSSWSPMDGWAGDSVPARG